MPSSIHRRCLVPRIIACLGPAYDYKTRIEAAHVVASLCSNSHDALLVLLQSNAHSELLQAIAGMELILPNAEATMSPTISTPVTPTPLASMSTSLETLTAPRPLTADQVSLASGIIRALRWLLTACSDVISPPIWGLSTGGAQVREEARTAIEQTFQVGSYIRKHQYLADSLV